MRVAIYFTPPAGAPLTRAAAEWLGRSAFDGEPTRAPEPVLDALVAEPARYGFHATMKAPFRLRHGVQLEQLDEALAAFASTRHPVLIEELAVAALGPFFAFVPKAPPAALSDLEAAIVTAFEPFRAPLTEAEVARRRPERLTERQRDHVERFGYPHVLDDFRFHMTLTGAVDEARRSEVRARLGAQFGALDGQALLIDQLALVLEPAPGEPFRVHSLHPFEPAETR
ncbi:DUF1045 domain-containing protein [Aurantimonas sp. MSK8Z-1]|uniref:DUF1045 domain-containing protein n=1 Tax=Mangrovibrevibacter kandeliae TaxID=2968473 RepID=UPI002117EFB4|nr:DUF1045 domain-containing protein [Aurantimonas sp. MSK8Z-1]MCW4114015.1 DUF1045 domain-containing protein [Aurantimonas sp. MSK8Z-1]